MRKSRFAEAQMVAILREADKSPVAERAPKSGADSDIADMIVYLL